MRPYVKLLRPLIIIIINISQGSVATCLRCGRTFNHHFFRNLLLSLLVKKTENLLALDKVTVRAKNSVVPFSGHGTYQLFIIDLNYLLVLWTIVLFAMCYCTYFHALHCYCSLLPPYGIGQAIIFLPCGVFLSSSIFFFPRLISAAADRMSTILPQMVWP